MAAIANPAKLAEQGASRPVFDRMNLSIAVSEATNSFQARWRGLLGLESNPEAPKEHWTRIKALSRRLAEGWQVEGYDTLLPVADLRYQLQRQVFLMLQRPVRWTDGEPPTEDEREALLDAFSNEVTSKLIKVSRHQLRDEVQLAWQKAYAQRGVGSTFDRARIIATDVYERGAPIPTGIASPDQNRFLRTVAQAITEVAEKCEITME